MTSKSLGFTATAVLKMREKNPTMSQHAIARAIGVSRNRVATILHQESHRQLQRMLQAQEEA